MNDRTLKNDLLINGIKLNQIKPNPKLQLMFTEFYSKILGNKFKIQLGEELNENEFGRRQRR